MTYREISSGPDWDLRLHRNGRFALRWDIRRGEGSCRTASGQTLQEVLGGLLNADTARVVQLHQALRAASGHMAEAVALQSQYADKMRKLRAAAVAQGRCVDLDAALAELREDAQGGVL